jgi:DNA-nicking Smr family endonuclease
VTRGGEPVRFALSRNGERLEGIAPGIDRSHLKRLARGEIEPDSEIDLHGLDRRNARFALRAALHEAHAEGERCVRVVHGRGLHSDLGPVLKEALVEWLGEPPLGPLVMAFASAPSHDGGSGATYVLLRRRRG